MLSIFTLDTVYEPLNVFANVYVFRAINEGRMAARDVDTYLTGVGTQLPVTGGIVKRPPYELLMHKGANGSVPELITAAA